MPFFQWLELRAWNSLFPLNPTSKLPARFSQFHLQVPSRMNHSPRLHGNRLWAPPPAAPPAPTGSPCLPSGFSTQQQNKLLSQNPHCLHLTWSTSQSSTIAWKVLRWPGPLPALPPAPATLASLPRFQCPDLLWGLCACCSFPATLSRCLQARGSLCPNATFSVTPSMVVQHQITVMSLILLHFSAEQQSLPGTPHVDLLSVYGLPPPLECALHKDRDPTLFPGPGTVSGV